MAENLTLVAPMLESRSLYSNFWCGVTPQVQLRHESAHSSILSELSTKHLCLLGLLQANPGLPAHQGVEEAWLFPCSHGAQHLSFGSSAWIQPGLGFLPTSSGLQLGLWWYHGVCLLGTSSRSVCSSHQTTRLHARKQIPHEMRAISHCLSLAVTQNKEGIFYIMPKCTDEQLKQFLRMSDSF